MKTGPREELIAAASILYGDHWKRAVARFLDVNVRTVRGWASGERETPEWALERLRGKVQEQSERIQRFRADNLRSTQPIDTPKRIG